MAPARCHLLGLIFLHCVWRSVLSEPTTWLMQGGMVDGNEPASWLIQMHNYSYHFPVSTRGEVYFAARPGELITSVIAAAVYQRGHVSVVEGGYGAEKVRVRYVTKNYQPDVFTVLLQTARRKTVSVDRGFFNSTRLGIAYEPASNWSQQEAEDPEDSEVDVTFTTNF